MTNPTNTAIHQDVGLMWNMIDGTTTTIVTALITKAKNDVKDITGTTSGNTQDRAIRALADAYTVSNAMANLDPQKDNFDAAVQMRDDFLRQARDSLRVIGKSLDGVTIQFYKVNP